MPEDHDHRIAARLEVERLTLDDGVEVIGLTGELDVATVGRFDAAVRHALDSGVHACVADLAQLAFIDSTGLAALLRAMRSVERAGGRFSVACANPTVLRLFEVTRSDVTLDVSATREQALTAARRGGTVVL